MNFQTTIINELEGALGNGSADRRAQMLRKIADLFFEGATGYSDQQIALFDEVLSRLASEIEDSVKAELSRRVCDATTVPPRLLRQLAFDDFVEVAAPLLARSKHLDDGLLVECAHTQSQGHLLAISQRSIVSEAVTDELVTRGEAEVLQTIVENGGSRFSNIGYSTLVRRADGNDTLTVGIGRRADLPRHHFLRLLAAASSAAREKLEAANPQNAMDIQTIVSQVTESITIRTAGNPKDYSEALQQVCALNASNALGDLEILEFIVDQKLELVIAALTVLAKLDVVEIEKAMVQERDETLLTIVKAIGLGWPTTKALLQLRAGKRGVSSEKLEQALSKFTRLKIDTAQQVLLLRRQQTPARLQN